MKVSKCKQDTNYILNEQWKLDQLIENDGNWISTPRLFNYESISKFRKFSRQVILC